MLEQRVKKEREREREGEWRHDGTRLNVEVVKTSFSLHYRWSSLHTTQRWLALPFPSFRYAVTDPSTFIVPSFHLGESTWRAEPVLRVYTILLYNVGRGLPAISRVIGDSCEITLHKTRFKRDVGIFIFLLKRRRIKRLIFRSFFSFTYFARQI